MTQRPPIPEPRKGGTRAPVPVRPDAVIPFRERFWRKLLPPKGTGAEIMRLNRSQRRLLGGALTVVLLLGAAGLFFYFYSGREERSMAAVQQGLTASAKLDYKESIRQFTRAISVWPDNSLAYLDRGNSHAALGETKEALSDWEQATKIDPNLADAYTALGTRFREEGNSEQALINLNRSLELQPSVDAYYQRGQLYAARGDYGKALEDYNHSIAERRDAPYVYRARSAARKAVGDLEGAAEDSTVADRIEGARGR